MTNAELIWTWASAGFGVMATVTLLLRAFDRRRIGDANVWAKPLRFAIPLAIHYATFAVFAHWLTAQTLSATLLTDVAGISAVAGASELAYISVQAARRRHSHFNQSTRIEAVASILMGVGALIVLSPALVVGLAVAISPPHAWPGAVTFGVASGSLLSAALTVLTAARMGATRSHFATKRPVRDRTMPVTGWSLEGSDLRPSHFLATHTIQGIPLLAVASSWFVAAAALPHDGSRDGDMECGNAWHLSSCAVWRVAQVSFQLLPSPRRLTQERTPSP